MEIKETLIRFKTHDPWFTRERLGLKCNTIRRIEDEKERSLLLSSLFLLKSIEITNTETKQYFTRLLTDISYYDHMFIFSWSHPGDMGSDI